MAETVDRCPECGSHRLEVDARRREVVCRDCGLVLEDTELALEEPAAPPSTADQTSFGQRLPRHLERAQKRADELSSSERRWIAAKQEAHRIASVLACPRDVADRAADLIKAARKAKLTQGRSLDALAAASLMAACRILHMPRTEADLREAARAGWSDIQAAYKALVTGLELPIPPMTAHEYMAQLASQIDLGTGVEAEARDMLSRVCGTEKAAGKSPLGWAAAALVLASRESEPPLSMNRAAEVADVSPSTVKARVDELEALRDG